MHAVKTNAVTLHVQAQGPEDGPVLVFANSLGTDFRIWNSVLPLLPPGLRVIRYDKRGHGLSDLPSNEWGMGDHLADLIAVLDAFAVKDAVICGLSVGGMIAQGIAAERPDLVRGLILADTGAKIGTSEMWEERVRMVHEQGLEAMAGAVMERWFTAEFRANSPSFPLWQNMLCRTTPGGYAGTCQAIADTDLIESTSRLRIPCLGLCGDQDLATPPDLVRDTVDLIPGSRFELIQGAGHIPCVEQPVATATAITGFLNAY